PSLGSLIRRSSSSATILRIRSARRRVLASSMVGHSFGCQSNGAAMVAHRTAAPASERSFLLSRKGRPRRVTPSPRALILRLQKESTLLIAATSEYSSGRSLLFVVEPLPRG